MREGGDDLSAFEQLLFVYLSSCKLLADSKLRLVDAITLTLPL